MNDTRSRDEQLMQRLPLPLAQLCRRAQNAKTPLERHLTAYYLWEAALKLLGATAIAEYADLNEHDPELTEKLKNLARPSVGHWWEFVRRLVPVLADRGDKGFGTVRELVLGRARDDLPRTAGLYSALVEALDGKGGARTTVRLTELFDRLVTYRNREIGHGAAGQKKGDFYQRMSGTLLAGLSQVLARLDVVAGRRLVYVADVRRLASGGWLIERYALVSDSPRRLEPLKLPEAESARLPHPERVYLEGRRDPRVSVPFPTLRPLYPLVHYDADAGKLFFLNARRGKKQIEYLCYSTGEVLSRESAGNEQRELLAKVLGRPVDARSAEDWAVRSMAEEPSVALAEAPSGARSVGEFELLSRLGQGGMGVVYRAWQPSLGRQVALKCMLRSGDPRAEARFGREIRALGRIEHPNVVKVFTSGADGDQWFYVMELIEGAELASVCEQLTGRSATDIDAGRWQQALSRACSQARSHETPISKGRPPSTRGGAVPTASNPKLTAGSGNAKKGSTTGDTATKSSKGGRQAAPPSTSRPALQLGGRGHVRQVVEIVRQVAEAAHALHEAGVVHRDIKPGNIMLTSDGAHPVLMDLGLAQLADETDGRLTRTRQFVGTLRYASPEQVLAAGQVDHRSDVYSLGATLWELLTLRPLYGAGEQTATADLMQRIQYEEVASCRKENPRVGRDLEAVVMKCREKDPRRRYQTAQELSDDLGRYLAREPVQARPAGLLRRGVRKVKRHPGRVLGALALMAVVGCLALGWWYWDAHYRTKVEYYAAHARRWGVPVGVGRVSEEEAQHRYRSWKFTLRGGRVDKVEKVNGSGYPKTLDRESALLRRAEEKARECSFEYPRNTQGEVLEEIARDRHGQVVWTFHYSTRTTGYYADERGIPRARSGTGAAFVEFVYTPEGFEREVHYLDKEGKPQANHEQVFGSRSEFDERGLTVATTTLDAQRQPTLARSGFASVTRKYDERGNETEQACFGVDGQPVMYKNNFAKLTWKYDEHGNKTDAAFFGVDGQPVLLKDGYAKLAWKYDERGNMIEVAYFGVDGKSTLEKDGVAKTVMKYDERGNETEAAYFGPDDMPVFHKDGYAKQTWKFDERGNITEAAYFGPDDMPVLHKDGYAKQTWQYDERSKVTERACFGVDGRPVLHKDGWAKVTPQYDERGNVTEQANFGLDGLPVLHKNGFSKATSKYDDRGNKTEEAYFGLDGRPVLLKDGYAKQTWKFDERGNITERACFGVNGLPTRLKDGFAKATSKYDARGNKTELACFGVDGRPALHTNGYAKVATKYDERGNNTEEAYFGVDGRPVLHKDGYAKLTLKYDERGNKIEATCFGVDGRPTLNENGYAKQTWKYDQRGNVTELACFGVNGQPVVSKEGYAKVVTKYNERSNVTEQAYFGIDGQPALYKERYAKQTWEYDERGNVTEQAFFGVEGRPALHENGYAKLVTKYDERSNVTEQVYFGIDGQPALHKQGYAKQTWKYDERGNMTERACVGMDGRPVVAKPGFAKVTSKYDERGNVTEQAFFGADGRPILLKIGYAKLTQKYDERGNVTEQAFFGADGKPVLLKDGYAKFTRKYDERGNKTEEAYFGVNGQPALFKDGYAKQTWKYDESSNKIEATHFRLDGSKVTQKFDERGKVAEEAYLDVDGNPVLHKDGYARVTWKYDERGSKTEEAYFGVDGQPALLNSAVSFRSAD